MTGLPAILAAAYEMGGVEGWTVVALLGVMPAVTLVGCLALVLHRPKPPVRRPARLSE